VIDEGSADATGPPSAIAFDLRSAISTCLAFISEARLVANGRLADSLLNAN
jgi:hypothetical protein